MYRQEAGRSWVHGIDPKLLAAIGEALEIPLICCGAKSETYDEDMECALRQAQELGAQACVFGDIDTPGHREWDEARCAAVGMDAILPLWERERVEAVRKTLDLGYRCLIKCVRNDILPVSWLGQPLTHTHVERMLAQRIDACGENGEYHTIVVDGPLFSHAVAIENHGLVHLDQITAADLTLENDNNTDPIQAALEQNFSKGLVMILLGGFLALRTQQAIALFPLLTHLYGVAILIIGIVKLQQGVDLLRLKARYWFLAGINAVLAILFAAIILNNPFASTIVLWRVAAITLIVEAVLDVVVLIMTGKERIIDYK